MVVATFIENMRMGEYYVVYDTYNQPNINNVRFTKQNFDVE